jgi:hypothetical protein
MDVVDNLGPIPTGQAMVVSLLEAAALRAGDMVRDAWVENAMSLGAPAKYVRGIADKGVVQVASRSVSGLGVSVVVVVRNTWTGAALVDRGHPAYNLAEAIHWPSPKTKFAANGSMYINVPMRQKTARMPRPVVKLARQLGGVTARGTIIGPKRLRFAKGSPLARYDGLIRRRSKRGTMHGYLVIRRLTPRSHWIIPAKAGLDIPNALADVGRTALHAAMVDELQRAAM